MFQKFRISSIIISEIYHFDKSMNTKNTIVIFAFLSLLFAGCNGPTFTQPTRPSLNKSSANNQLYNKPITINDKTIYVQVVDSDPERELGLSGRESLEDGQGMLFDFTNTSFSRPSFWMKDMKFSIDIVWIKNQTIVGITPNIPAPTNPNNLPTYPPPSDITHVLELPSGYTERARIKTGDTVKI